MVMNAYAIPGVIPEQEWIRVNNIRKANRIVKNVCQYLDVDIEGVLGYSRKGEHVYARQWCIWFCIHETTLSLKRMGSEIFKKDHSTMIHNRDIVRNHLYGNWENYYKEDYPKLQEIVLNGVVKENGRPLKRKTYRKKKELEVKKEILRANAIYSNPDFSKKYL